ncbi:Leucine-rich repeat [Sesbania bispinosa]|nr:Leucine-rich repeat [Sesbania bispinosa]
MKRVVFVKYPMLIFVVLFLTKELEGCLEKERLGLLELKNYLISNSSNDNLPSWVDDSEADCCVWERVKCNHTTGHVMDLLLGGVASYKPQHELRLIDLSHNKLGGDFPSWLLQNNTKLETLYLMNNSFTGTLQLPTFKHGLLDLQISNNKIGGQLPENIGEIFSTPFYVNLSRNCFEGILPSSISEMQTIRTLDLSNNNFSGELTRPLFSNWTSLVLLRLSHNNFHGPVIPILSNLTRLRWLYLNNNSFSGELENGLYTTWGTFTVKESVTRHTFHIFYNSSLSLNHPVGDKYMISYEQVEVEFRTKSYYLSYKGNNLDLMTGLDLSSNELSGSIPPEIGELREILALNLSHNRLSGSIPERFSNLINIESLDLSYNNLSGEIPPSLSELYYLAIFNVSYNNLSGTIPTTGQFANFDENNYRGC